jgi:hypothetical protein
LVIVTGVNVSSGGNGSIHWTDGAIDPLRFELQNLQWSVVFRTG